jgi:hypothetical protein
MKFGNQAVTAQQKDQVVAFIKNGVFKSRGPCGIVAYSSKELKELFGSGKPELAVKGLRLIHEQEGWWTGYEPSVW